MFNKSKLAAILEDEGLIKTARERVVALVTVRGGRKYPYTADEIQEFLDNKRQIIMSDNLPKWLYVASNIDKVPGLPKSWNDIWKFLEKVQGASKPVQINVQSDDRSKNGIKW